MLGSIPSTVKALGDPYSLLSLACGILGITSAAIARPLAKRTAKGKLLDATNIALVLLSFAAFGINVVRVAHSLAPVKAPETQYQVRATFTADVDEKHPVDVPFHVQTQVEVTCGQSWSGTVTQRIPEGATNRNAEARWLNTMNVQASLPTVEYAGDTVIGRGFLSGRPTGPFGLCQGSGFGVLALDGAYNRLETTGTHSVVISTVENTAPVGSTLRIPIPATESKTFQCHLGVIKLNPQDKTNESGKSGVPPNDFVITIQVSGSGFTAETTGHASKSLSLIGVVGPALVVRIANENAQSP